MTESEFLTSEDPAAMLRLLMSVKDDLSGTFRPSDRKLRLFACAYCRAKRVAPDLVDRLEQNGSDAFESDARWAAAIMEDRTTEPGLLASLLREVIGNPFRSIPPLPSLYTGDRYAIHRLAQDAYNSQDFNGLPVLADALEEAGYDNEHVLRHLRGEELVPSPHMPKLGLWQPQRSPHVRGCWALDLLLGEE